jgi:TetR/AcrR family transcriptional repressor of nem operon
MARPKEFAEEDALQKAMQIFWLKGYHNASMQELVEGMGISRGSLYDTFGDKHDLYVKALNHYQNTNSGCMVQAVEQAPTVFEKIKAVFDFLINDVAADPKKKGCFMTNATLEMLPDDSVISGMACSNFEQLKGLFTELLRQGIAAGEFRADLSLADTAHFLIGMMNGLRVVGKVQPSRATLEGMVRVALNVLR